MRRSSAKTLVALSALVGLASCSSKDTADLTTTTETTTTPTSTTTTIPQLEQPAIWPAANVSFQTPQEAAEDFVRNALGVEPHIGEFQGGDSLSGEIDVYSPESEVVRGTLLLRKLGPSMSWFVTAAVNANNTISSPAHQSSIDAAVTEVTGKGRGYEAQLRVTAIDPSAYSQPIDQQFPMGGSAEEALPFSTTLDLSDIASGSIVTIILQGSAGLEEDPGDFCAIAVRIN